MSVEPTGFVRGKTFLFVRRAISQRSAAHLIFSRHALTFGSSMRCSRYDVERHIVPHSVTRSPREMRARRAFRHAQKCAFPRLHMLALPHEIRHAHEHKKRQIVHAGDFQTSISSRIKTLCCLSSNSQRYLHAIC